MDNSHSHASSQLDFGTYSRPTAARRVEGCGSSQEWCIDPEARHGRTPSCSCLSEDERSQHERPPAAVAPPLAPATVT